MQRSFFHIVNWALILIIAIFGYMCLKQGELTIKKSSSNNLFLTVQNYSKQPKHVTSISAASVRAPSPLNQPSKEESNEFPGAIVVESAEIEGPGPGQKTDLRILKTNFKYPLIRTEEIINSSKNEVIAHSEMVADHLLVTLSKDENPEVFLEHFGSQATSITRVTTDTSLYRLNLSSSSLAALPKALDQLTNNNRVVHSADPDFINHPSKIPNEPNFFKNQWAYRKPYSLLFEDVGGIDAIEAWNIRTSAPSIIVAIVDTGIRYTHQDLKSNMWNNAMPLNGDLHGWNAIDHNGEVMDGSGHGSMCAGIIGAAGHGIYGVAWKVQLMSCKFIDNNNNGADLDAIEALNYARTHGANIINCSWGQYDGYSSAVVDELSRARDEGIIIVAGAGNDDSNNDDHKFYPASYKLDNIVAVAATTEYDTLADFSNYGATTVHLAAPGIHIISTCNESDSSYAEGWGTSFATPYVSGGLALLMEQFSDESYTELINRLLVSSDKIPTLAGKTIAGRLNIAKALALPQVPSETWSDWWSSLP